MTKHSGWRKETQFFVWEGCIDIQKPRKIGKILCCPCDSDILGLVHMSCQCSCTLISPSRLTKAHCTLDTLVACFSISKDQLQYFQLANEYRELFGIDGEPIEFEWNIFPRTHNIVNYQRDSGKNDISSNRS